MSANGRTYSVIHNRISVSTAITIIQIKAGTASGLHIIRAWCNAANTGTSFDDQSIQLNRKSGAATVTSFTPLKHDTNDPVALAAGSTTGTGITASAEGTDTDVLVPDYFASPNGFLWIPTDREFFKLAPGEIMGMKFPVAPGVAMVVTAGITFIED